MRQRLETLLGRTDPRLVWIGMVAIALFVAFEGWYLVVRVPFVQWRQLHETRVALAAGLAAAPREPAAVSLLAAEVQTLSNKLRGELTADRSDEQLTTILMAELDRSASSSGTFLKGVKPASRQPAGSFQEISYEVAAEGPYLKLGHWMLDLDGVLGGNAAVVEFSLKATPDTRQGSAHLKLALYREALPRADAAPQVRK